jgi:hypothetical protein
VSPSYLGATRWYDQPGMEWLACIPALDSAPFLTRTAAE